MHKLWSSISVVAALFLAACGDSSTSSEDSSAYESVLDLPNCTALEAGMVAYVKAEKVTYVCSGGEWVDTSRASSSSSEKTNSGASGSSSSVKANPDAGSIYDSTTNTLTDLRDGQVYRTTTISIPTRDYSEVWTAENMNYTTDNSYCHGDEPDNCDIYGRLYTWEAALNACPQGWHLPSSSEWEKLILAAGGKKLKSTSGWSDYEGKSGNGTDIYSFAALPAGTRSTDGKYYYEGYNAIFWSSTESKDGYVYVISLDSYGGVDQGGASQGDGLSVRCLKD